MRIDFTYEIKTDRGIAFSSIDCEVDAEIGRAGSVVINGVFIGKENLFNGETLHRSLACAIAGEAENSKHILSALEDEAAEEFAERQARRQFA